MKILKIEEIFNFKPDIESSWYSTFDGFRITTDSKVFELLISNGQDCCEDFGSIVSEDNLDDFIGSEIKDFKCVDSADYNDIPLFKKANNDSEYVDVFDCAFIDFNTNKGTIQFAVYNHHNGYYGHDIVINEKE